MSKGQTAELLPAVQPQMPVARPTMGVPEMLQAVIEKGVTQENVAAVGEIVKLYERMQAKDSEKEFNRAFVALQAELPTITASTAIPNRGKYEKFEDVMKVVGPLLGKHGFTVSFTMDFKENRIIETCHLRHVGGYSQPNSFAVRVGKGDSDTQADCKAATTAKRNALLNALNIVIRQDCLNNEDDAGIEGDPDAKVTKEQADELEKRAQLSNSNITAFLKLAQADKFANIPARNYAMLDEMLSRKERGR